MWLYSNRVSRHLICKTCQVSCFLSRKYGTNSNNYDVAIVGGGIVGLATAQELIKRQPKLKYIVLEKEKQLASHQTGHNSGVIHAGIYYKPGTLKAKLCVEGLELTYKYCDEHNIPYKKCGKIIVAVTNEEVPRLEDLYKRGVTNGAKGLTFLSKSEMKELEPHCEGKIGLYSPNTGIVDWGLVARKFGDVFEKSGGTIVTGFEATDFRSSLGNPSINTNDQGDSYPIQIFGKSKAPINCRYVLTCGGLQSDKLAEKTGCSSEPKIVPFRGEYLVLKPHKQYLVKGNIYPVPDPKLPFLGVHFTPRMDGGIWLGPNALLAFKREGYKFTDFNIADLADSLSFRGPSGVRAQALDKEGNLVDDFVFDVGESDIGKRVLHVRNAPSPAATSSLAIAKMVADRVQSQFQL
ncbi:L-2-hydroxyglutarate dehydrogenase, mitochondrial-like isoform X2 [Rhopilema esculentum]|uniref:L-2-hydroxyglutarate dehydrogenase, mitochondrial-like isoform X2 n=1 Tax=Rhopilema esculentum TaxID=499914 RepID=UPI0031E34842